MVRQHEMVKFQKTDTPSLQVLVGLILIDNTRPWGDGYGLIGVTPSWLWSSRRHTHTAMSHLHCHIDLGKKRAEWIPSILETFGKVP